MTDLKDLTDNAALAAGKSLVKAKLEELTMSDEEKAGRAEERAASRKKAMIKYGAIGIGVLILFASLVAALMSLWPYVLGLAVVGGLGAGGFFYLKPKVLAARDSVRAKLTSKSEPDAPSAPKVDAAPVVDAAAARKQKLEDELAALKRKA